MSYATVIRDLDWVDEKVPQTYMVSELGVFDEIRILEFVPGSQADASR